MPVADQRIGAHAEQSFLIGSFGFGRAPSNGSGLLASVCGGERAALSAATETFRARG